MAKTTHPRHHAGEVLTFDVQADIYGGQYQLVERIGPNRWTAVRLPPSEIEIAAIRADTSRYARPDETIETRFYMAGRAFTIEFSSRYYDYF